MSDAPVVAEPGRLDRWSRLASVGLVMAAIAPLLMLAAGLVWGLEVGDEVGFFGVTGAIGLLASFLVRRPGALPKLFGIVAAVLIAGALFWTAFGLFTPTSFFDFMPGVLVMPGAIIAIVGSVAAIRANRAGTAAEPTDREGRTVRTILTVVTALAVVSGVLTFVSQSSVDDAEATDAAATVILSDFEFDSDEYSFEGGSQIVVKNDDPFMHTFTVEALDIDEAITPGSETLIEIPGDAGDFTLFCRPHTSDPENPSEDDMAAQLTIE